MSGSKEMKYLVTGSRGALYECSNLSEARKAAGKFGIIEKIGKHAAADARKASAKSFGRPLKRNPKNGLLSQSDAVRLIRNLPLNVTENVHSVRIRRVDAAHFVIDGERFELAEAANIVANKNCG